MKSKISIIIPIYNVEQYLSKCIDSVLAQTHTNFELLLINDGSTDNSGKICDEYAARDSRIRVFHTENGGVSSARNLGLDNATGEWVSFVDSDDYVQSNFLELLHSRAVEANADIVICNFYLEKEGAKTLRRQVIESNNSDIYLREIFDNKCMGAMWNKLIKHELYIKYNIHFPQEIFYCEDVCALTKLMCNKLNIAYVDQPLYNHIYNSQSITRNINKNTILNRMLFIDYIELNFNSYNLIKHKLSIKFQIITSALFNYKDYKLIYPEITDINVSDAGGKKEQLLFFLCRSYIIWILCKIMYSIRNYLTK